MGSKQVKTIDVRKIFRDINKRIKGNKSSIIVFDEGTKERKGI